MPSHLYSYSFELNPSWSRSFSPQPEIQAYLRSVAAKYDVADKHLFDTEVTEARWDAAAKRWLVDTTNGAFSADVLVGAVGALAEPNLPDIKGIENFRGEIFHSARWNHDVALAGKRVALIGTGASAIQVGPAIAGAPAGENAVGHLDVYQRTAPWVMPRHDRAYPKIESLAYKHVPGLQRLAREAIYWGRETYMVGFGYKPEILQVAQKVAQRNIAKGIADPALRAKVTPDWQIGCKRILISNTWYPMLAQDNVDVVTDGIAEIRENAIVSTDGTVREVDAIVVATGFHVTDSPTYERIVGADGRTLAQVWAEQGQQAYRGASVHGFPNLLFVVGPNTGLGHSSMVYMIESQLNYLSCDALAVHADRNRSEPPSKFGRTSQRRLQREAVQERMGHTIWTTGGCASLVSRRPRPQHDVVARRSRSVFRRLTRHFDLGRLRPPPPAVIHRTILVWSKPIMHRHQAAGWPSSPEPARGSAANWPTSSRAAHATARRLRCRRHRPGRAP